MAMKKKPVKKTAAPKDAAATASASPKVAAAASPKVAPAEALKKAPRPEGQPPKKAEKKAKAPKPSAEEKKVYTEVEIQALTAEAVAAIRKGIADASAQANGQAFIPAEWATKFKDVFGAYKKWVKKQTDKFYVQEDDKGGFTIKNAGDPGCPPPTDAPNVGRGSTWKQDLNKAWMSYCQAVPKENRKFEDFIGSLPKGVRKNAGGLLESPKLSPKLSPKVSPQAASSPKMVASSSPKVAPTLPVKKEEVVKKEAQSDVKKVLKKKKKVKK